MFFGECGVTIHSRTALIAMTWSLLATAAFAQNPSEVDAAKPFDAATRPRSAEEALAAQAAWARHTNQRVEITNSIGMKFKLIPPGMFLMGSPTSPNSTSGSEGVQHRVKISQPFYLGVYEVTQAEWKAVMGTEPWKGHFDQKEGPNYPATYVGWGDAQEFCRNLSQRERGAGQLTAIQEYKLPSEAQWEYACRANTATMYSFGDDASQLGDHAWFFKNAASKGEVFAHLVGQKRPSTFGLYDMYGNVEEWCQDAYDDDGKVNWGSETSDPVNTNGEKRVFRGGYFGSPERGSRSAFRSSGAPDRRSDYLGFRVASAPVGQ